MADASRLALIAALALCLPGAAAEAQSLYKYLGPDGDVIYTDRRPPEMDGVEERKLLAGPGDGRVTVSRERDGDRVLLVARNPLHAPVQLRLLPPGSGVSAQAAGRDWLLPPQSRTELREFAANSPAAEASVKQRYAWLIGDPQASHRPPSPYRAPFPAAVSHPITQAWPDVVTHTTPDSAHAVDIAMPIGSDVLAAREGVVIEVASTNFRSSTTPGDPGARANLVRILHDDGTFAIYAHLNWNTIRVRPGQRVRRGEYIADSGNTGFSTGPHLHFVVMKNADMKLVSLPVTFDRPDGEPVTPVAGDALRAH